MSKTAEKRIRQRYTCTECDRDHYVRVSPNDATGTIRYACPDGCGVVEQVPSGVPRWFEDM